MGANPDAKGRGPTRKRPHQWAEIETDDIKIVVDGSKTNDSLIIRVHSGGLIYRFTDILLEMILTQIAEEYSNKHLNFEVYHDKY